MTMKSAKNQFIPLLLAAILVAAGLVGSASAEIKAGAALRNVTPNPLLPVSGGSYPHPVKDKKGELEVRVLVLEEGGTRIAIVSEPFLGFPAALCAKVAAGVKGIAAENILIGATHTHGAPDPYGFPNEKGEIAADVKYLDGVCAKSAEAINEAISKLEPVEIKIATEKAKGKISYNYYAPQLYDPRCTVIQAIGRDGKPRATLINYAIHPECMIDVPVLTPDLVGPLQDRVAEKGGGIAVFMNGAQGGMITADVRGPDGKDIETWEEASRIGTLLADEALRIIGGAAPQKDPKLFCASTRIKFPFPDNPGYQAVAAGPIGVKLDDNGKAITARINVVNLGTAQILTIPGEALPNIGYYLKRKMHGEHNLLFGLTNDAYGYILTKVDWNSFDRYEYVSRTSLGEMTGEILIENSLKFVDSLPRPVKP